MGTDTSIPANSNPTPLKPADSYGTDQQGIICELRVISFLLAEGLHLDVDLDAIRQQFTPFKL